MNNQPNNGSNAPLNQRANESASRPYMQSQPGQQPNQPGAMPNHFNANPANQAAHSSASSTVRQTQHAPINRNAMGARPDNSIGGAPNGSDPNLPEEEKPKKRPAVIAIAVILVAVIASGAFCAWWFLGGGNNFFDSDAVSGQAPYKTQEEIIAELNRVVEEGMLNISIASLIEFENGESEGTAYIENVPSNRYVLRVTITLNSTGEVVYQSGGLHPDSYIEKIRLTEDLPAGNYPATAKFVAYDPDTLEEVGQASARITIQVNS